MLPRPLFSFVILADCHIEPEASEAVAGTTTSRNNQRARAVVETVNGLDPDFIVFLGDYVQPTPALAVQEQANIAAADIFAGFKAPVYATPGNVDIGDKPSPWMPAAAVSTGWIERYSARYGAPYQSIEHRGCWFVFANSPVMNSGLPHEKEQSRWLNRELARLKGNRIFFFTHYPLFIMDHGEPGHYDNIDEPARFRLLELLAQNGVEACFSGHVHNFFYNRRADTEFYVLPSTAFTRRDYAEMFKVEPSAEFEFGRNDTDKLGFFLVDIYDDRHVARLVRTGGRTKAFQPQLPLHPKDNRPGVAGVYLRHPWAERISLPLMSPVDEFARKETRNDHIVQTLWDIGITELRVPSRDLFEEGSRRRMSDLSRLGHKFVVSHAGLPNERQIDQMVELASLVQRWEIILPRSEVPASIPRLGRLAKASGLQICLAVRRSLADSSHDQTYGKHFVSQGFLLGEEHLTHELLSTPAARKAIGRIGFNLSLDAKMGDALPRLDMTARQLGIHIDVAVTFAREHPDEARMDHSAIAAQVATASMVVHNLNAITLIFDTFIDVDRGYFPRGGLIDRRCNLRPAGYALSVVNMVLAGHKTHKTIVGTDRHGRPIVASIGLPNSLVLTSSNSLDLKSINIFNQVTKIIVHDVVGRRSWTIETRDGGVPGQIELPREGLYMLVVEHRNI